MARRTFEVRATVDVDEAIAELPFKELIECVMENEADQVRDAVLDHFDAADILQEMDIDQIKSWLADQGGED